MGRRGSAACKAVRARVCGSADWRKRGVSGFAGVCEEAGEGGGTEARSDGSGFEFGDYGDRAAGGARIGSRTGRRPRIAGSERSAGNGCAARRKLCAAVRESAWIASAAAGEHVWKRAADVPGV